MWARIVKEAAMGILKFCWNYVLVHGHEILWALIFAVTLDTVHPNSLLRRLIRKIGNKLAEQSVERLRARIVSLEKYREDLKRYLVSDKSHYLVTLRLLFIVLAFMCIGSCFFILDFLPPVGHFVFPGGLELLALGMFVIGIFTAMYAARIASFDTQEKIAATIESVSSDIEKLSAKLPQGTARP
jgi:hypothetical protein